MHTNRNLITGFLKSKLQFKVEIFDLNYILIIYTLKTLLAIIPTQRLTWSLFQGIVISDFEGLDRITSPPRANYTYSVEAGVIAGIDMVGSGYT